MYTGTTPQVIIKSSIPYDKIKELWLTYASNYKSITKKLSDCVNIDGNIVCTLSQADTIALNPNNSNITVNVQVRILTTDEKAYASRISKIELQATLTGGEINVE